MPMRQAIIPQQVMIQISPEAGVGGGGANIGQNTFLGKFSLSQ